MATRVGGAGGGGAGDGGRVAAPAPGRPSLLGDRGEPGERGLVGEEGEEKAGDELRDAHDKEYAELIDEVEAMEGASELIAELDDAGGTVGLATLCVGGGQGVATIIERV